VVCVFVNQMSPRADVRRVEVEPTHFNSGRLLPRTLEVRMPGSGIAETAQFPSAHTSSSQRLAPDDTASASERGSSQYAVQGHEMPLSQLDAGGVGTGKGHSLTIEMPLQDYQQFRLSRRNSLSTSEGAQSSGTSVLPENSARRDDDTIDTHVSSRQRESGTVEMSATHGAKRGGVAEAIKAAGVASPNCGPPQIEHLTSPAMSAAETEQPFTMSSGESGGNEKRGRMKNLVVAAFDYDREEVCEMSCR